MSLPLRSIRIDASAIGRNLRLVRAAAGDARVLVRVPVGAYEGVSVARVAVDAGADGLVVASVGAAVALRDAGVEAAILAWMTGTAADFVEAAEHGVLPVVSSIRGLDGASTAGIHAVYLAVAVGASVTGCQANDWEELVDHAAELERTERVRIAGIIGCSERQTPRSRSDLWPVSSDRTEFALRIGRAREAGLAASLTGIDGSAAALAGGSDERGLVVIERALYGISPFSGETAANLGLAPAVRVSARVIATRTIGAGEGISYGHTYRTTAPANLALVAIGYVHGIDRAASNRGTAWLNGKSYPIAGRVAMDVLVLDLGADTARAGDEVVLFGAPADGHPSVEDWAKSIGMSADAIVAGITTQAAVAPRIAIHTGPAGSSVEATVDLAAYRRNLAHLRGAVFPADLMVVVKGDAYGHGLLQIARTAIEEGITRIGVLDTATGLSLRDAGVGRSISLFAWLLAPDEDYRAAIDAGIELGVSHVAQLRAIAGCGASERARLHLEIDTGLHRNGANDEDWPELVREAVAREQLGQVETHAVWSHIAEASDEEDTAALRRFETAIRVAEALGARFTLRHLAASAAGLARADCRFDLVRMGAFTYGISPGGGITPGELGLTPVMSLRAPVTEIVRRHGRVFATVPLGFVDGIPTGAPGVMPVTIGGTRHPIVGAIEHDRFAVDLGAHSEVRAGDPVVIYGGAEPGELTVQEWADALHTIGEELVVRVSRSIPRRYVG